VFILKDLDPRHCLVETSNLLTVSIQALLMLIKFVVVLVIASFVRSCHDLEGYLHLLNLSLQLAQLLPSLSQVSLKMIALLHRSATILD